jgi:Carboxypeptidase regulatory-like domain
MMKRSLFTLVLLLSVATAEAANVRGRVLTANGAVYPDVAITLQNRTVGRTATVFTAEDGLFQLHNIPPGNYVMEVKTPRTTKSVQISVTAPTETLADVRVQ